MCVDDRTPAELGVESPERNGCVPNRQFRQPRARWSPVDVYISRHRYMRDEYNDIKLPIDKSVFQKCKDSGLDDRMAAHVAHIFSRDPLALFEGHLENLNDEQDDDHFGTCYSPARSINHCESEMMNSTNWKTMRFKPPPPHLPCGWRVEFRPMELRLSDFENAAFVALIVLLSRVILEDDLDLYTPLSMVLPPTNASLTSP